ncbi:ankyrin, partial [Choiromyces venosus 120613-1]
MNDDLEIVSILTSSMANLEAEDTFMRRPIHLAAQNGSETIVHALIQCGAIPHSVDSEGNLPLHLASAHGHHKAVKKLIEKIPSESLSSVVNTRNALQLTPLHLA